MTEYPAIMFFTGQHRFLSNFWPCPVEFGGLTYMCAEAAFQAQRCPDLDARRPFTHLNGTQAKKEGNTLKAIRPHWSIMRLKVMSEVIHAKFAQSVDLRQRLLQTEGHVLIQTNFWMDQFWGVYDGRGNNYLGKILMCERNYWLLWTAIQKQCDPKYDMVRDEGMPEEVRPFTAEEEREYQKLRRKITLVHLKVT